jgi:hypothetical protein
MFFWKDWRRTPFMIAEVRRRSKPSTSLIRVQSVPTELSLVIYLRAGHGSRAVWGMDCLRWFGSRDREFESHTRHGCLVCMRHWRADCCLATKLYTLQYYSIIGNAVAGEELCTVVTWRVQCNVDLEDCPLFHWSLKQRQRNIRYTSYILIPIHVHKIKFLYNSIILLMKIIQWTTKWTLQLNETHGEKVSLHDVSFE